MLAKYTALVAEVESGNFPPCLKDRTAAVKRLVDDICSAPWESAERREAAQKLVARLERLRHRGDGNAAPALEPSTRLGAG